MGLIIGASGRVSVSLVGRIGSSPLSASGSRVALSTVAVLLVGAGLIAAVQVERVSLSPGQVPTQPRVQVEMHS